ncbi:MAG: DUF202 domain-containing protein [Acetobacteraceae bacterium]
MINHFSDHAANERTFLAWVRTAIAVMAFGFLVEKFDLFLEIASRSLGGRTPSAGGQIAGNIAGLALICLGAAMMAVALVRFRRAGKAIDDEAVRPGSGEGMDTMLAALLTLLGAALFVYLLYTVLRRV